MAAACWAAAAVWSGVSPVDGSLRAVTSPMDDNAAVKPAGSGEARPERKRGQAPDIRMRWVAPCSILIVGLIAASISRDVDVKWSNCPCTVHGTDEEANHQLQLNDVVQATILASECLSRALYPSPIDEVWLSYVFQHSAPGLCPSSACTADQSLYVDRGVVLFIPWSRGLLCEDFSLLIQSLIPIMSQRYKYVTVHPFVNGLFSTPATAALSRFHITELSPVSMRGVLLPPLPIPSSVVPPSAPSRDLLLGFCTQSLNLHKLALRMLYGDADGENITCRWPLLVEDVRCVFRATLSMLRHEWNMTQSPLGVCGSPSADDVVTVMRASEFFICPQSTGYGCDLLSSAIQHGAIPVYVWFSSSSFIHGHTLPYHHSLPWADMAVSIHWSQLHKLQRILQGITHGDRARRRARLAGYYQTHFSPDGITAQIASWLRSPDHSGLEIIPVDVEKRSNANEGITVLYPNPLGEIRQAVAHPGVGRDVACVAACSGGHLSLPSSDADDLQRVRSAVCLNNCAVLSVDSAMAPSATVMDVQLSDRGRLVRDVLLRYRLFERSRRDLLLDITSEGTLPTQLRIDSTRIVTIREATMQVLREVTRNDVDAIERWRPSVEAQAADFIDQLVGTHVPSVYQYITGNTAQYMPNFGSLFEEQRANEIAVSPCIPRNLSLSPAPEESCFGVPGDDPTVCKVLLYTSIGFRSGDDEVWNFTMYKYLTDCTSMGKRCIWTRVPDCLHSADVVVFADWTSDLIAPKVCGQKRILVQLESPLLGHSLIPEVHLKHYFDGVSTYRLDSDIPFPYFPYDGSGIEQGLFQEPVAFHDKRTDAVVAMMVSNCDLVANRRLEFAHALMQHMAVHSYGTCLHNHDFPTDGNNYGRLNFFKNAADNVLRHYKFLLVFENSNCVDYVTEKLWRAYRMGTVPVYMGAPNVKDSFAPDAQSIILTSEFAGPEALSHYLTYLSGNETAYNQYLSYKSTGAVSEAFRSKWLTKRPSWQCRVCAFAASGTTRHFWRDDSCVAPMGMY